MKEKNYTHNTRNITEADHNTNLFMATRDRFNRSVGHREICLNEDRQRKDRLLREKVLNKARVLNMYEDLRNRSDLKNNQRDTQNILMHQQRKQIYNEVRSALL